MVPLGRIVTFYSYKGGSGRSMALANLAWVLASNGARVLVVDWDLEAPGLHRYFRPFLSDKDLTRIESQGVIDFMVDFAQRMATPPLSGEIRDDNWYRSHADVANWSKRLLWPSGEDAKTLRGGTVDFVPAGRQGPQYARRVNSFDWTAFYERYNGGAFLDGVRESMRKYDWVLIDSRTGVSDTSGICTVQLPDILVVCFTLNYQGIEGSAAVAASAQASRKGRELRILPLPTRLDGNEEKLLAAMMQYARTAFDPLMETGVDRDAYWQQIGVPYLARYNYSEKLAPFEATVNVSASTLPAIERLASHLTEGAVTRCEPLPEPHRADVLTEFEALPETRVENRNASRPRESFLRALRQRITYRYRSNPVIFIYNVVFAIVVVVVLTHFFRQSRTPANVVRDLVADARKDIAASRRAHGALLIAEAAARLDPAAVVGSANESTRPVYEGLLALQPLTLAKTRGPQTSATIAFSPDGKWIASAAVAQPVTLIRFPPTEKSPDASVGYSAVAFSPDSQTIAVGGRNGSLNVLDVNTRKTVWQWENNEPNSAWVDAVAFSPNGNLVALGTDTGRVEVVRAESWRVLNSFAQRGRVLALAFSPDSSSLASGGDDTFVHVWSLPGKEPPDLYPHATRVRTMAFAPVGSPSLPNVLVTLDDEEVLRVWAKAGDNPNESVATDVRAVAVAPVERLIAIGGLTGEVQLLRLGSPYVKHQASIPVRNVSALAFSADGKWLAVANTEAVFVNGTPSLNQVSVWDVATRQQLQQQAFFSAAKSVALSPDSRYVVAATGYGVEAALLHPKGRDVTLSASEARQLACTATTESQMSQDEWEKYFGSEPLRYTCGPSSGSGSGGGGSRF
jgi:WD40 repeat protein/MinD-like ATPase involved in chromosome partitioning or flagellar assembly